MEEQSKVGSISFEPAGPDISSTPPVGSSPADIYFGGRSVDSMTSAEAQEAFQELILDSGGKYSRLPGTIRSERAQALFRKGFAEKVEMEAKARREQARLEAEKQIEKFQSMVEREEERKLEDVLIKHFGSEKTAHQKVLLAQSVVKRYASKSDLEFFNETGMGSDPEVIKLFVRLGEVIESYRQKKGGKR